MGLTVNLYISVQLSFISLKTPAATCYEKLQFQLCSVLYYWNHKTRAGKVQTPLSSLFCIEGKEEKDRKIALLGTLRIPKRNGSCPQKRLVVSLLLTPHSKKRESTEHWEISMDHILWGKRDQDDKENWGPQGKALMLLFLEHYKTSITKIRAKAIFWILKTLHQYANWIFEN